MVGIGLIEKKTPLAECSMRDIDANGCKAPATLMGLESTNNKPGQYISSAVLVCMILLNRFFMVVPRF